MRIATYPFLFGMPSATKCSRPGPIRYSIRAAGRSRNCAPGAAHAKRSVMDEIGRKRWAIAEGYIPAESCSQDRALLSHETACILNAGDREAKITLTIYFADRDPAGPYRVVVPPRRTFHLRFNDLKDPEPVPLDTDYSSVFESYVPIVVQHTRLDSRRAEISLLSTIAYSQG